VLQALDDHADVIFPHLMKSVVPPVDLQFLQSAGFEHPEAELALIIHYARSTVAKNDFRPSQILDRAKCELERVGEDLRQFKTDAAKTSKASQQEKPKARKLFTGISKILAGGITGTGNLLLGIGAIPAAGPSAAHMIIGSCAVAVGAIGQGIGDLRGE